MVRGAQRFENVVISSVAHVDAPNVVTSAEIEAQLSDVRGRLGLAPGMLETLAGIKERRFWDEGVQPSEVAARAGELAIQRSKVRREDIGVVINTSVCRDYIEPSVASFVHHALGLATDALNFDLGNACLGFLNGMAVVASMIERGEIDHGIVVDGESSRFPVESTIKRLQAPNASSQDLRDQFATLTLGSGSAAMVLSRADLSPSTHRFVGGIGRASTQHSRLCLGQRDEMRTDTKGLLAAGLDLAAVTWREANELFGVGSGMRSHIIHQISSVHTQMLCQRLGIDLATVPMIFPMFGNTGPASVPMVLSKEIEKGAYQSGDRICLMGMGSGINCVAYEVVW